LGAAGMAVSRHGALRPSWRVQASRRNRDGLVVFCPCRSEAGSPLAVSSPPRREEKGVLGLKVVVGLSGASGAIFGIRLLDITRSLPEVETHLVISRAARLTIVQETDYSVAQVQALADISHEPEDVGASIASGSFPSSGMVVIPCSMKTLSAIATGFCADLLTRAADVTLKEGRPLILVVRETPLHLGHLRRMVEAAEVGAVIFPLVPAFYTRPLTLQDMVDQTVGRILARLGIPNGYYHEWKGT